MFRPFLLTASLILPTIASAEVPRVITDIAPVESMAAMVLGDLGTPDRLSTQGVSPHHMALRPSQARALSQADLIIWIGPDLTPQLTGQIETLAPDARSLPLAEQPGTTRLPTRDSGLFAGDHDHGHEDGHDDHDEEHDEDHAAAHDPHLWLSPDNATVWLNTIAEALANADTENADTYRANAAAGVSAIETAGAEARAVLTPIGDRPLAVAHDAFQYFEVHFGLTVLGAISDAEANTPGPARLAALRDGLAGQRPACVLTEPGTDPRLLNAVQAADIPTAVLDPLGTDLAPGPLLYPALIRDLAQRIATCAEG